VLITVKIFNKICQSFSFTAVIKTGLLLLYCFFTTIAFAQDRVIEGIVFDKDTKERIARVNVLNLRTRQSIYNNLKAEFRINAHMGDQLVLSKQGYRNDTLRVKDNTIAVYLKSTSIMLREVTIKDTLLNPVNRLAAAKKEYSKVYGSISTNDYLTVSPGSGAGIGIDAIYNALSRSGRNAAKLRKIIDRDYQQNVVDYRFNKALVRSITGLIDPQLSDFMQKYRPGYYMVVSASDYDFISSIRANYRRYKRNPSAYTLPELKP
jgi:hypothetical protein